jgi:hypothetical protein
MQQGKGSAVRVGLVTAAEKADMRLLERKGEKGLEVKVEESKSSMVVPLVESLLTFRSRRLRA